MSPEIKNDLLHLLSILESIDKIKQYSNGFDDAEAFFIDSDQLIIDGKSQEITDGQNDQNLRKAGTGQPSLQKFVGDGPGEPKQSKEIDNGGEEISRKVEIDEVVLLRKI